MNKALNIAIILTAYDKATRVINDAVDKSNRKIKELKKTSQENFGKGLGLMASGAAIAAPLATATQAAIAFEDKMADVAKVMNLEVGGTGFKAMSEQAKELAVHMGRTSTEAAEMMANLAAGGTVAEDMLKVGKLAGEMGVAFGMTANDAGNAFIKIKNALGKSVDDTKKVTDAINFLSDTMASEAPEIVNYMASGGSSVAAAFKIGGEAAAAFGSTLISVGKSSSEAATIMERFAKGVFNNADMKAIFDQAGGGAQGFMAVLNAGRNAKDPFSFFQKFGQYGTDIQLLASNFNLLKGAVDGVADATNYADSVNKEFINRQSTTQGRLDKLKASWDTLKVTLGETFLPIIAKVGNALASVVNSVRIWAAANPNLAKTLGYVTAAVSGVLLLAGAFFMVKGAVLALQVILATNPIILTLMGIAVAAAIIIANWDKIAAFFVRLWNRVKATFMSALNYIKYLLITYTPAALIFKYWDSVATYFTGLWERVKLAFLKMWEWVKGLAAQFYQAGVDMMTGLWEGIKSMVNKPIEAIQNMAEEISKKFKSILKIQSPSKVFMEFGGHIAGGAAIGVKGGIQKATDATKSLAAGMGAPAMQPAYGGGATINYSPSIVINGSGAGAADSFRAELRKHADEIMRMMNDAKARKERLRF